LTKKNPKAEAMGLVGSIVMALMLFAKHQIVSIFFGGQYGDKRDWKHHEYNHG
jgi:hypothetical protein